MRATGRSRERVRARVCLLLVLRARCGACVGYVRVRGFLVVAPSLPCDPTPSEAARLASLFTPSWEASPAMR